MISHKKLIICAFFLSDFAYGMQMTKIKSLQDLHNTPFVGEVVAYRLNNSSWTNSSNNIQYAFISAHHGYSRGWFGNRKFGYPIKPLYNTKVQENDNRDDHTGNLLQRQFEVRHLTPDEKKMILNALSNNQAKFYEDNSFTGCQEKVADIILSLTEDIID